MHRETAAVRGARVLSNPAVCREHHRLALEVDDFPVAEPGQFVHLCPSPARDDGYAAWEQPADGGAWSVSASWTARLQDPMLRRAFSIAGLRRGATGVRIDVIYRVVGTATRWMASLVEGDSVSLLGPLGNRFPLDPSRPRAWLVSGGVGLPPMLWLAEALTAAGVDVIAFCGARRSSDLLPLTLTDAPSKDAARAVRCAGEFEAAAVIATDDGSLGFAGHVGGAVAAFHAANAVNADEVMVYVCGPEIMMRSVSEYCLERGMECQVCMERNMACGLGTCQSCVVPVEDSGDAQGWRYALCCTEGPVFDARRIMWEHDS